MGCFGDGGPEEQVDITKGGLVKNRKCTDVLCVGMFFTFLVIWFTLAGQAFKNGDPSKMIFPADSFGNLCGKDENYVDKKYVLYFDIAACMSSGASMMLNGGRCPTHQMCVAKCPDTFWLYEIDMLPYLMVFDDLIDATPMSDKIPLRTPIFPTSTVFSDEWFSNFHCKPQAQIIIDQIYNGTIMGKDVFRNIEDLMSGDRCSSKQMPSSPIQNRCFPGGSSDNIEDDKKKCEAKTALARNAFRATNETSTNETPLGKNCNMTSVEVESGGMKEILADLQQTWRLIAVFLTIAIVISLIWILILRFVGGKLVWGFIIGTNLLFIGGCYYSYNEWQRLIPTGLEVDMYTVVSGSLLHSPMTWQVLMVVFGILGAISVLLTLFMFNRIRIATTIMEEATKAVGAIPLTMVFPVGLALMYLLVVYWYTSVAAYTATAARPVYKEIERDNTTSPWTSPLDMASMPECNITEWNGPDHKEIANSNKLCILDEYVDDYGWTNSTVIVQLVHIFGFYWSLNIVTGIGQVTLAGCFATWYFARRKPKDIPQHVLLFSFLNIFKHFGTIVFGAFIIAIVQLLQTILNYIEKKTKRIQNPVTKAIICCLKCCLWCMEKCLKYISQNAYIITAMYGYGFIRSACKAMKLIIANMARAAAVTGITSFVLLIGKLLISVGLALWSYYLFDTSNNMDEVTGLPKNTTMLYKLVDNPELVKSTEMVVLLIFIGSYVIASGFFKVYAMAISTIFICFLEDLERNDGSAQKPYFMSKSLMKVMGKKNAAESTNTTEVSKVKKK